MGPYSHSLGWTGGVRFVCVAVSLRELKTPVDLRKMEDGWRVD